MNWKKKEEVGANLLCGLFIPVGERQKEGHDYLSKCDGLILRGEEMKSSPVIICLRDWMNRV